MAKTAPRPSSGHQNAPEAIPPERRQHGKVTRAREQIADSHGSIGRPYDVEDLLGQLQNRGTITPAQRKAGELFAQDFHLSNLHPLRAASLIRTGGKTPTEVPLHAKRRLSRALDALGGMASPCGSAAWNILGTGRSIYDFANREGWSGRALRHETAKHLLIGALSVLAAHYGLERNSA